MDLPPSSRIGSPPSVHHCGQDGIHPISPRSKSIRSSLKNTLFIPLLVPSSNFAKSYSEFYRIPLSPSDGPPPPFPPSMPVVPVSIRIPQIFHRTESRGGGGGGGGPEFDFREQSLHAICLCRNCFNTARACNKATFFHFWAGKP